MGRCVIESNVTLAPIEGLTHSNEARCTYDIEWNMKPAASNMAETLGIKPKSKG